MSDEDWEAIQDGMEFEARLKARKRHSAAVPTTQGSYESLCAGCGRLMEWTDKRCILCTDCRVADPTSDGRTP